MRMLMISPVPRGTDRARQDARGDPDGALRSPSSSPRSPGSSRSTSASATGSTSSARRCSLAGAAEPRDGGRLADPQAGELRGGDELRDLPDVLPQRRALPDRKAGRLAAAARPPQPAHLRRRPDAPRAARRRIPRRQPRRVRTALRRPLPGRLLGRLHLAIAAKLFGREEHLSPMFLGGETRKKLVPKQVGVGRLPPARAGGPAERHRRPRVQARGAPARPPRQHLRPAAAVADRGRDRLLGADPGRRLPDLPAAGDHRHGHPLQLPAERARQRPRPPVRADADAARRAGPARPRGLGQDARRDPAGDRVRDPLLGPRLDLRDRSDPHRLPRLPRLGAALRAGAVVASGCSRRRASASSRTSRWR